jgi:hypothetical protein
MTESTPRIDATVQPPQPLPWLGLGTLSLTRWLAFSAVAAVFCLAAAIRFVDLDHLTFRIDELYTLLYSRQSWADVAGLNGYYDSHPPLYYVLVKAANALVGDELGARAVAALFGFLTIPLLFIMVARLLDAKAGLVAALLLAVAPVHIESSRDGRMYTAVMFFVLLSYAFLLEFVRTPRFAWAAAYAASLAVAVYLDYTAIYPLIPQAVLVFIALRRHPAQRKVLLGCLAVAVLSYVPWLPQFRDTVNALSEYSDDSGRDVYLGASWAAIRESVPYVLGLDGRGSSVRGYENAWVRWPDAHLPLLLLVIGAAAAGVYLMRRRPVALLTTLALALGAPITAIVISLFSPAYANRTVQIAVIGWCIAVGWLASRLWDKVVPGGRVAALGLVATLLGLAAVTVPATMSSAGRYEWREVAAFLNAHNDQGRPLILHSNAGTLTDALTLYGGDEIASQHIITITDGIKETFILADRWIDRGFTLRQVSDGALASQLPPDDPGVDVVWFASRNDDDGVTPALEALGYRQVLGIRFARGDVWLYLRPFAIVGTERDVNGEFIRGEGQPEGWAVSGDTRLESDAQGGRDLVLPGQNAPQTVTYRVEDGLTGIYTVTVQARSSADGALTASLRCYDSIGRERAAAEQSATFTVPLSSETVQLAVQCRNRSPAVELALTRSGSADVVIERVMLTESPGPPL